jgi:glutamate racemase
MNTPIAKQPIGIFDSGMGGLTVVRKLAELLPHEDLVYLGDTARVPYGNRSPKAIIRYSQACVRFLLTHSVKHILIACNTASAVALEAIAQLSTVPVTGVIKPAARLVAAEKYARVGVIGTRTTIQSQAYEIEIQAQRHPDTVFVCAQACPLFVPLIEEGWEEHAATRLIAKAYLEPIKRAEVEALILGCTHYPFLREVISRELPEVHLIDSGVEAAMAVAQRAGSTAQQNTGGKISCYVTDVTPTFSYVAQQFLGVSSQALHPIHLPL